MRQRGNYKKLFSFQGAFNVSNYDVITPDSGARKGHKLLRFLLVPADGEGFRPDSSPSLSPTNLLALRQELISQTEPSVVSKGVTLVEYRRRSNKVRKYAVLRAKGKCEACGCPPPFIDDQGNGFLEVHHILRLADDGVDAPKNVAAICPNCHRRSHYSADRESFRLHLLSAVLCAEDELAGGGN